MFWSKNSKTHTFRFVVNAVFSCAQLQM